MNKVAVSLVVASVATLACGGEEMGSSTSHPNLTLPLEPLVEIGGVDGPTEYAFSGLMAVRLLLDGRIVVGDQASKTIRLFGSDGAFEQSFGRRGRGPGEFEYFSQVQVRPPDTLVVYDSRLYRLTTLGPQGEVVSTLSFQEADQRPDQYIGAFTDGSHAIARLELGSPNGSGVSEDVMTVGRFDSMATLLGIAVETPGMRRSRNVRAPLPFSPHFLSAVAGDTLIYSDGLEGILYQTDPSGSPLGVIRVPGEGWSFSGAWAEVEGKLDSARIAQRSMVSGIPASDSIPIISDLLVDPVSRLWAKRYAPDTDSHWIRGRPRTGGSWVVLHRDGTVVAEVTIPDGFRPMDVTGSRVAGISIDRLGVERVHVFELPSALRTR